MSRDAVPSEDDAGIAVALGSWHDADGPLYVSLADAVTTAIGRRRLQPGDRLPPERVLAAQLAVGRNTVIRAYEVLRERGLVESRRGSGSWVAASAASLALGQVTLDGLRDAAPAAEQVTIDLATASLGADVAVLEEFMAVSEVTARRILDGPSYSDAGSGELREAIAARYTAEGLPTAPEQILVTSGAQQSLSLIARRFLATGDVVVVEEPTSAGLLDILSETQAVPRSAREHAAASVDDILDTVQRARPTLVYLALPGGIHGRSVRPEQVVALAEGLSRQTSLLVEDTSSRDLSLVETPHLAALATTPVLTVGSMSKLYWGGLRIGWIRGPESLIEGLTRTKARADLGTSVLSQHLAVQLIRRHDEILERRRAHLRANVELAGPLLRAELPELEWIEPDIGPAIWARLPIGSAPRFVRHAHDHGVRIASGEAFSSTGRSNDRVRISLAPAPETIAEGIRRLGAAWRSFAAASSIDEPSFHPRRES